MQSSSKYDKSTYKNWIGFQTKNEILKLFPEPVFKYHIEDSKNLNSELSKYIYTLHDEDKKGIERSNRGGWHSKNFNISDNDCITCDDIK